MKTYAILVAATLLLGACGHTNGISDVKLGKSYGPVKVVVEDAVDVSKVLSVNEKNLDTTEFTFEGKILEVCSKAGCWVNVDKGNGETFMVRFKDHFTIPPDTKPGTMAYFHGIAFNDVVSVDLLKHFAEDAGKSQEEIDAITEPQSNLGFTADGIVLKK